MIYTGIGSRKTPKDILRKMRTYGDALGELGFTLRSGGADGADLAFEEGCIRSEGRMEIYLPWKGFNNNPSPLYEVSEEALEHAADIYGPSWQYLKRPVKLLMGRNMYQVLGKNLDTPSHFVICWTSDGCMSKEDRTRKTGGTGQAIACASELNIPIFNLQQEGEEGRFFNFLQEALGEQVGET